MTDQKQTSDSIHDLKHGVFWLGGASILSRIIDASSVIVLLAFLTREQMGLATLAWSVAVIVESLVGFGTNTAIIQAKTISPKQISSVFWITCLSVILLCSLLILSSSLIEQFYEVDKLGEMIKVVSLKILFIGIANIPLALLSRQLQFQHLAALLSIATLFAAITNITLAVLGLGAWAPLIANVSHGFFQLVGAWFVTRFKPQFVFDWKNTKPLLNFGVKVMVSNGIRQFSRNLDFFLIGKFLDMQILGLYRVAFDVAVIPANEIVKVIKRSLLPVFSKMDATQNPSEVERSLIWSVRSLFLILLPFGLAIAFVGEDLVMLFGKKEWVGIKAILPYLCVGAIFFSITQLFTEYFSASGHPEIAIMDSILTVPILSGLLIGALTFTSASYQLIATCIAWAASYFLVHGLELIFIQKIFSFSILKYVRSFVAPFIASSFLLLLSFVVVELLTPYGTYPKMLVYMLSLLVCYGIILRYAFQFRIRSIQK